MSSFTADDFIHVSSVARILGSVAVHPGSSGHRTNNDKSELYTPHTHFTPTAKWSPLLPLTVDIHFAGRNKF